MTKDGGPAFPVPGRPTMEFGMSLRDYFAGKVIGALVREHFTNLRLDAAKPETPEIFYSEMAIDAYMIADLMIAKRET